MEFPEVECMEGWNFVKKTSRDSIFSRYVESGEKMSNQIYKNIYLDNAATTQMAEAVEEAMQPYLRENFGNASTIYSYGEEAKEAIEHTRKMIADSLEANPSEI